MNQGETSSGASIHPLKRRRGRPPKDPSLKRPAHIPPDLDGVKQYLPPRFDPTANTQSMVGQAVTGVVEATLDAGYLLNVRIGNSPTNFRGIVFKPGHYVPVTTENDVAPHLQMINRNGLYTPTADKLAIQTVPPPKRKYKSRRAASPSAFVPPVGVRGNVVPVVLQPVNNFPNGLLNSNQMPPRTGQVLDFGDKDVHMVEPLSMLPPDRSIPAGQIFLGGQPHASHRVPQGSEMNEKRPFNEGEKVKPMMELSDVENGGSAETSDSQNENGKEGLMSPTGEDDSGIFVSTQETGNGNEHLSTESLENVSVMKPTFDCGPGRMTDLLQAVEENKKENQVQLTEQPIPGSKVELR